MRCILLLTILISGFTFAGEEKDFSPTDKFLEVIQSRQARFDSFRTKVFQDEVCPGSDYSCVLKNLKSFSIQSSGDLDNGLSLLSFMAQKRFKKGECKEICRMNIYAEYSAALVDFLGNFDRSKIFVNLLPKDHPETKYLVINEELRFFEHFGKLHEKLSGHYKKIDVSKIFNPQLAQRMESLKEQIALLRPSVILKGSYLSALDEKDEVLKVYVSNGIENEQEKMNRKELVSLFRSEVR